MIQFERNIVPTKATNKETANESEMVADREPVEPLSTTDCDAGIIDISTDKYTEKSMESKALIAESGSSLGKPFMREMFKKISN